MFSEKDKIDIRERIELQMADVSERIQEYKELTKPTPPSVAIGRISRMDAINNRSINEAALRQLEEKLKGLQSAICRLNDNKFGRCLGCGEMIPIGRIILVLGATKCVRCS